MTRRKTGPGGMTEARARLIVRDRAGQMCEIRINGVCLGRGTNYQHRRNRSQQGPWTPSNGLWVCGSGTTGCHGHIHHNVAEATAKGWTVKSWEDWQSKPVLLWSGLALLDDRGNATPFEVAS